MKKDEEKLEKKKRVVKTKKDTKERIKENSKNQNKKLIYLMIGIFVAIFSIVIGVVLQNQNKKEVWVQDGDKLTKGDVVLTIGDYYEYDESSGGEVAGLTDVNWKVLGLDEQNNLLIVSDRDVTKVTLGSADDLVKSQDDFLNGTRILNSEAEKYGNGKNAIRARSINITDINRITGVDYSSDNGVDLSSYGSVVTYSKLKDKHPVYKSETGVSGSLSLEHEKFVWFDSEENEWTDSTISNEDSITVTNTWYAYSTQPADGEALLDSNSKKYEMLFSKTGEEAASYWLAGSSFVYTTPSYLSYGYQNVMGDSVNYTYLLFSNGVSRTRELGVRVVVVLGEED